MPQYHPPLRTLAPSIRIRFLMQLRVRQHYARLRATLRIGATSSHSPNGTAMSLLAGLCHRFPRTGVLSVMSSCSVPYSTTNAAAASFSPAEGSSSSSRWGYCTQNDRPALRDEAVHVSEVAFVIYKEGREDFREEGIQEGRGSLRWIRHEEEGAAGQW